MEKTVRLESKEQIENIMLDMIEDNLSPDVNDYFYLHKSHENKGINIEGYSIIYAYTVPVDEIYLAPSIFMEDYN
jgi:hypothetical protein